MFRKKIAKANEKYTPENLHGSPKNHPIAKEHHFPSTSISRVQNVNFAGYRMIQAGLARGLKITVKGAQKMDVSTKGVIPKQ